MFKNKYNKIQLLNIVAFLIVPIISSFISTYHIVDFFELGNYTWMAILLSVAFELGALASALSITVLDKISKGAVWAIFIILVAFQMIGNVYYTFQFINVAEMNNSEWLAIASKFIEYWYEFENADQMKMFLSILIGIPIPLISLAFLKTLVDYSTSLDKEQKEIKELEYDVDVDGKVSDEVDDEMMSEFNEQEEETWDDIDEEYEEDEEPPESLSNELESENEDQDTLNENKTKESAATAPKKQIDDIEDNQISIFDEVASQQEKKKSENIPEDNLPESVLKESAEKLNDEASKQEHHQEDKDTISDLKAIVEDTYKQVYGEDFDFDSFMNQKTQRDKVLGRLRNR